MKDNRNPQKIGVNFSSNYYQKGNVKSDIQM